MVTKEPPARSKHAWKSLAAVCVLVVGSYAYLAQSGLLELLSPSAADTYYNLLVRGFCAGHLSLQKEVPPGLAQLADPYDSTANAPYRLMPNRLHDLSYYKGRLYLYHGVTPALILFWPFAALTGRYLLHRQAVAIFCAVGFLASTGLLYALWRRYFAEVSAVVVTACAVALGLATGASTVVAGGCLSGADLLRVYADHAGAGGHLVCVARAGLGVSVAVGGECGLRAGSGSAALIVVRRSHPAGAGGSSVA